MLHIVMIDRTFSLPADQSGANNPEDQAPAGPSCEPYSHLYATGRAMLRDGRRVTVLTGGGCAPDGGGTGRITLFQHQGLAIICYDPYRKRSVSARRFARWATGQVDKLPRPALILVAVSSLGDCCPVVSLSRFDRVPLVLEVRRPLLPTTGLLGRKPFPTCARHFCRRVYRKAETVIALSEAAAREAQDLQTGAGRELLCPAANNGAVVLADLYTTVLRALIGKAEGEGNHEHGKQGNTGRG